MMNHPKYTLLFDEMRYDMKFVIMEHASFQGGMASKEYNSFKTFDDAMKVMGYLSKGPILLASSAQSVDNVVDLSRD
jgi:hypothetical protein